MDLKVLNDFSCTLHVAFKKLELKMETPNAKNFNLKF